MSACTHEDFVANVDVHRMHEEGEVTGFLTEIHVRCADCGEAFGWRGVPCGISVRGAPMRSADATELRAWLLSPADMALADGPPGVACP